MPLISKFKISCLICVTLFSTSVLTADNNDFSDGELANLLIGQSITCNVKGTSNGEATWIFGSINNNKIKGKLDFKALPGCSSDDLSGKIKNNRVQFFGVTSSSRCWGTIKGYLDFSKGPDGNLRAKGNYKTPIGNFKGSIQC